MSATTEATTDPFAALDAMVAPIEAKRDAPRRQAIARKRAAFGPILDTEEPLVTAALAGLVPRLTAIATKLSAARYTALPEIRLYRGRVTDALMLLEAAPARLGELRRRIERPDRDPGLAQFARGLVGYAAVLQGKVEEVEALLDTIAARAPQIVEHIEPVTGSGPILTPPPRNRGARSSLSPEDDR